MQEMSMRDIDEYEGIHDSDNFFTPAEKSLLVHSCINRISVDDVSILLSST